MGNQELKNAYDLCSLLRSALTGEVPAWQDMDLPEVYRLAKKHSLAAMACMALEPVPEALDPELASAWKQERDKALRKTMLLTAERQAIFQQLDAMGCWYLPLKGIVLAELYPRLGMRQMADNDILFDPAYRRQVKEVFLARGYECEDYGRSNHDVYQKPPVYNYEMHVALFGPAAPEGMERYYRDVAARLLPVAGMEKRFSREDFYIYFLAHGYKHFSGAGNGLRFLLDGYVYRKARTLDMAYVAGELEKLGLTAFEVQVRLLSEKLFATGEALTVEEERAFGYCVSANTYGTQEHRIENELRRLQPEGALRGGTKLRYLWRRLWPDRRWFQCNAPFFARWWILKPCYLLWRGCRGLLRRGRAIAGELSAVFKGTIH